MLYSIYHTFRASIYLPLHIDHLGTKMNEWTMTTLIKQSVVASLPHGWGGWSLSGCVLLLFLTLCPQALRSLLHKMPGSMKVSGFPTWKMSQHLHKQQHSYSPCVKARGRGYTLAQPLTCQTVGLLSFSALVRCLTQRRLGKLLKWNVICQPVAKST